MTQDEETAYAVHTGNAAIAEAMSKLFPADRRQWLNYATADMDKAVAIKQAARYQDADVRAILFDAA